MPHARAYSLSAGCAACNQYSAGEGPVRAIACCTRHVREGTEFIPIGADEDGGAELGVRLDPQRETLDTATHTTLLARRAE